MTPDDAEGIKLAEVAATWSPDPYFKVGAVLVHRSSGVIAQSCNRPPHRAKIDWSDRDGRRKYVVHAEANALRWMPHHLLRRSILYVTCTPCMPCLGIIAAGGVTEVVFWDLPDQDRYPLADSLEVAQTFGVNLRRYEA